MNRPYCEADDDRTERPAQSRDNSLSWQLRSIVAHAEREKEREGAAREQQVLQQLWVRTQDRESYRQCEDAP